MQWGKHIQRGKDRFWNTYKSLLILTPHSPISSVVLPVVSPLLHQLPTGNLAACKISSTWKEEVGGLLCSWFSVNLTLKQSWKNPGSPAGNCRRSGQKDQKRNCKWSPPVPPREGPLAPSFSLEKLFYTFQWLPVLTFPFQWIVKLTSLYSRARGEKWV